MAQLRSSLVFLVYLGLLISPFPSARAAGVTVEECAVPELDAALRISGEEASTIKFEALSRLITKFKPRTPGTTTPGFKVVMAAIELGAIEGLKTTTGKPLNISAGGVSTVMTDLGRHYPGLLKDFNGSELVIAGVLMDGISTEGMTRGHEYKVKVDGQELSLGTWEYTSPQGAKYIFLEHELFKRFTVAPAAGESVYSMRGIESDSAAHKFEQQKIWSAFNQGIAHVYASERAEVYLPHDSHVSPATFYIHKRMGMAPISSKPLIHNERYMNAYFAGDGRWARTQKIWDLTQVEMKEYFSHDDQFVMLAPALRIAEQTELFSGISVAEGTATSINENGLDPGTFPRIELFGRIAGLTNFLGDESRPHLSPLLRPGTEAEIHADGITHPELVERFRTRGFVYGEPGQTDASNLQTMAEAKKGIQENFGMTVDAKKPLFLSFARLVYQKGMKFALLNVEHILDEGGQVIIGGPVGDSVGAEEQAMAIALKERLTSEGHPQAKNFVVIAGPVKGRMKGLLLAASDFFIIPSRYEPCGLTDCEALFHGTVPVAHDVGGLSKGENTILYGPTHPDDQGWALGEGINRAFAEFRDSEAFNRRRLAAMREDFSAAKHFKRYLLLNRIELYGKMLRELQAMVDQGKLTQAKAEQDFKREVLERHGSDMAEFSKALKMMPPHRRTPLMSWALRSAAPRP